MTSSSKGHGRVYLVILLIAITLVSIQVGAYYGLEKFFLSDNDVAQNTGSHGANANVIAVNVLLNFGNGTSKWFNETKVPVSWNFYNLTLYMARGNVESEWYPEYSEHFITGIDGISNSGAYYWGLWQYCTNDQAWLYSNVGADKIALSNNQTMGWYFESDPHPPPVPGSKTVLTC
jgi:uncharacterized protein DUF4430